MHVLDYRHALHVGAEQARCSCEAGKRCDSCGHDGRHARDGFGRPEPSACARCPLIGGTRHARTIYLSPCTAGFFFQTGGVYKGAGRNPEASGDTKRGHHHTHTPKQQRHNEPERPKGRNKAATPQAATRKRGTPKNHSPARPEEQKEKQGAQKRAAARAGKTAGGA